MRNEHETGAVVVSALILCVAAALLYWKIGMPTSFNEMSTVLPADQAWELSHQCSRISPTPVSGTWTPTAEDIAAMEQRLPAYVHDLLQAEDGAVLMEYNLQYGGLIVNGTRIVYINAFPEKYVYADWKSRAIIACDGGSSFWGLEYDPLTKMFSHFAKNGEA